MTDAQRQAPIYSEFASDPDMAELVMDFVDAMDERISQIQAALAANDSETLCRLAHQLKGAGGGYGFNEVTRVASDVETLLKSGAAPDDAHVSEACDALCGVCRRLDAGPSDGS